MNDPRDLLLQQYKLETEALRKALASADQAVRSGAAAFASGQSLIAQLDAQAAAMREALERLQDHHCSGGCDLTDDEAHDPVMDQTNAALAADAGKALLERLQSVEAAYHDRVRELEAAIREEKCRLDQMEASHVRANDKWFAAERERDEKDRQVAKLYEEREQLQRERNDARTVLRVVQWGTHGICPACSRMDLGSHPERGTGHAPDCRLAKAMGEDSTGPAD